MPESLIAEFAESAHRHIDPAPPTDLEVVMAQIAELSARLAAAESRADKAEARAEKAEKARGRAPQVADESDPHVSVTMLEGQFDVSLGKIAEGAVVSIPASVAERWERVGIARR